MQLQRTLERLAHCAVVVCHENEHDSKFAVPREICLSRGQIDDEGSTIARLGPHREAPTHAGHELT